jgi:hypothetical protein
MALKRADLPNARLKALSGSACLEGHRFLEPAASGKHHFVEWRAHDRSLRIIFQRNLMPPLRSVRNPPLSSLSHIPYAGVNFDYRLNPRCRRNSVETDLGAPAGCPGTALLFITSGGTVVFCEVQQLNYCGAVLARQHEAASTPPFPAQFGPDG